MTRGLAVHLVPGAVCLGCMILHAHIHVELTRHEWLGVSWLFERCCVLKFINQTRIQHVLGFQGSDDWSWESWHWNNAGWTNAESRSWSHDDSRTHARSMNHGC